MFIYSLPILFSHIKIGSPVELIVVVLFLYGILLMTAPVLSLPDDATLRRKSEDTFYKYLLNAWSGLLKLWIVFWPFFIFLNMSLFAADNLAKQSSITVSSWDDIHFMLLTPVILWTTSVWRCSANTGSRFWLAAARFMTLAVFFEYILKLIIRKDYPRIFFECSELMLDYGGCF